MKSTSFFYLASSHHRSYYYEATHNGSDDECNFYSTKISLHKSGINLALLHVIPQQIVIIKSFFFVSRYAESKKRFCNGISRCSSLYELWRQQRRWWWGRGGIYLGCAYLCISHVCLLKENKTAEQTIIQMRWTIATWVCLKISQCFRF